MGWARFDDAYTDHPKIVTAGPLAELLDMRAILFSARYETDGHIPPAQLSRIGAGIPAVKKKAGALVEVERWHEPGHKCKDCPQITAGWMVHDYLTYNPTRESKEAERAAARERMRKAREGKQGANKPRSSEGVRANTERTAAELRECSDNPDPAPTPRSKATNASRSVRATRIPDGWVPSDEPALHTEAKASGVDLHRELDRFRDYWQAKGGAGGRKADWQATWRNWVRKAIDDRPGAGPRPALDDRSNAHLDRNDPEAWRAS